MRRLAFLFILILGCSRQAESEQLRKSVVSWSASLSLAAQQWLNGNVKDHIVRDSVEGAVDELGNQAHSSEQISPDLTAAAAHAVAAAHDLDDAVQRHDRDAVARDARTLDAIARELRR